MTSLSSFVLVKLAAILFLDNEISFKNGKVSSSSNKIGCWSLKTTRVFKVSFGALKIALLV